MIRYPTILCIDDDAIALVLRESVLQSAGYAVVTAVSAERSLQIFKTQHIDLVITDHIPGDKHGTFLSDNLRSLSTDVPILLLYGGNVFPDPDSPPNYSLHKLEGPAKLIAKVRSMLPRRRKAAMKHIRSN